MTIQRVQPRNFTRFILYRATQLVFTESDDSASREEGKLLQYGKVEFRGNLNLKNEFHSLNSTIGCQVHVLPIAAEMLATCVKPSAP
jgi:hypothetical protein